MRVKDAEEDGQKTEETSKLMRGPAQHEQWRQETLPNRIGVMEWRARWEHDSMMVVNKRSAPAPSVSYWHRAAYAMLLFVEDSS